MATSKHPFRTAGLASLLTATIMATACGGGQRPGATATATPPPAPATPAPTPTPGRPAPALVQIENSADSLPHSGIQAANIVYEYLTEGDIPRLTVIYDSPSGKTRIEPVRSVRLITVHLQAAYGGVIYYSGGSDTLLGQIWNNHIPALEESSYDRSLFGRDAGRVAPHNLFTTGDQLRDGIQKTGVKVLYPPAAHAEPSGGDQVAKVSFNQTRIHRITYAYAPDSRTYGYSSESGVEIDAGAGRQPVRITNVVVVQVPHHDAGYVEDVNSQHGIDFDLGPGMSADVYTRGMHLAARFTLAPGGPAQVTNPDGSPLALPDGLTWVNLVDPGTPITAG